MASVDEIVTALPGLSNVSELVAQVRERAAAGDPAFAAELGIALHERVSRDPRVWQYRRMADRMFRLLATTPDRAYLTQALRLVPPAASRDQGYPRYAASVLAAGQSPDDLALAFSGGHAGASDELRACLLHELILRGVPVSGMPAVGRWATWLRGTGHPLGWLPLARSPLETDPSLPQYGIAGGSHGLPFGPAGIQAPLPEARPAGVATETTSARRAARMATAVADWESGSKGRFEARVFALDREPEAAQVPGCLAGLPLDCLRGEGGKAASATSRASASPRGFAERREPDAAWRILFAAAAHGGAYNRGRYGAYGRLAAWQSLAGITGASAEATCGEVETLSLGSVWHVFAAEGPWFHRVAWDFGIACLTSGTGAGTELAILAATDTD